MVSYLSESWSDAAAAGWTGPGWYFWDETEAYCHGPYHSRLEADEAEVQYARALDGPGLPEV
jgi:hypothetical protein